MKKLLIILLSLTILCGCSQNNTETVEATVTPSATTESFEPLNVLAPKGATALPLANIINEGVHNVVTVDGSEVLQASLVNPSPEYDIIIAPTNLGVKLATNGKTSYKLIDVLTWGNLYLVGSENGMETAQEIALFGENAVVGLVFEDLFSDLAMNKTYYPSVAEAQAALLSNNADIALLAEPAATATIAKAKENGVELQILNDLQQLWEDKYGGKYPQAGIFVLEESYNENPERINSFINEIKTFVDEANQDNSIVVDVIDNVGADILGVPNGNIASTTWNRLNLNVVNANDVKDELTNFLNLFGISDIEQALIK